VNRRLIIAGATILTLASVFVSLFLFRPPKPVVDIKGESLITIANLGSDILDVKITNTLFTAWVAMALLLAFWLFATRRKEMVPTGLQNLAEAIIEAILNFVTGIAGEKNGRRFFPLIATFFIYIAFANWLSLTPLFNAIGVFEPLGAEEKEYHSRAIVFKDGAVSLIMPGAEAVEPKADLKPCETLAGEDKLHCEENAREVAIEEAAHDKVGKGEKVGILAPYLRGISTDLMTTLSFAIMSAVFVEYWGISSLGLFRYTSKFFNVRRMLRGIISFNIGEFFNGFIEAMVGVLELVAEFARLISFSFRLFGNMLAGEILLLVMTFLVPLVPVIVVIFYLLEMFVGAIQAFVFGALTLVFAVLAVSHHGPEEHAEDGHH